MSETKMDRLHMDTKGHVEKQFTESHWFFLTFVAEYSRFVFTKKIRAVGEASEALLHFVKCYEK